MSVRPTGSLIEFSSPAPFFLVGDSFPVRLGATAAIARVAAADGFTQSPQPMPRPGKLDAEDRKPYRYHDKGRPGRHDHYNPDKQHRRANNSNDNTARRLVGEMKGSPDQILLRLECTGDAWSLLEYRCFTVLGPAHCSKPLANSYPLPRPGHWLQNAARPR